jgi:transcriptional regulator with XRE-family HTH domain
MDKWHGRQITAARALAGLTIAELAEAAGVTERTVRRIESAETITIAERLTHGAISLPTWEKIIDAIQEHGVELVTAAGAHGAGVRWISRQ